MKGMPAPKQPRWRLQPTELLKKEPRGPLRRPVDSPASRGAIPNWFGPSAGSGAVGPRVDQACRHGVSQKPTSPLRHYLEIPADADSGVRKGKIQLMASQRDANWPADRPQIEAREGGLDA